MIAYWYKPHDQEAPVFWRCGSLGAAIDHAMRDFSAGQSAPVAIEMHDYIVMDYHDLHWLYSRTWDVEYDRMTGSLTRRRTGEVLHADDARGR